MSTSLTPDTRIALITGASRGLGRSAAVHLARAGVAVIGTYRSAKAEADGLVAETEAAGVPVAMLPLDVADRTGFPAFADAVRGTLAGWGTDRIHHLVNNAGLGHHVPFEQTTPDQLDELYRIHLEGPFLLTQTLLPLLADGGRILNVSSGLTRFTVPGYGAYAAMKGAVEVLTRYQAAELGARGIRVNTLAPGAVATDFGGGAVRDVPEVNRMMAAGTALGRVAVADDIGAAVPHLLAADLGWANGTRIELSGGQQL